MKPLIIANWKMNPSTKREAMALARGVASGLRRVRGIDVVIAAPFPFLPVIRPFIRGRMALGAQDVASEEAGAFTGEVSALMLRDSGAAFVVIGHSERRRLFGETDELINRKMKMALRSGLRPILAIGEDTPDSHDVVPKVLFEQLVRGLAGISKPKLGLIAVAYEPVWAISTTPHARADTPDNATRRAIYIRKLLVKIAGLKVANSIRILYGGSVNSKNASPFLASDIRGMDGLLVGAASLKAEEFSAIVRAVAQTRARA